MSYQHGSSHTSHASGNRRNSLYNGFHFIVGHISAEPALVIDIDSHINDDLARRNISVIYTISASFTTEGISFVLVWQTVTVAFFFRSIMAAGFPTTRLLPTTTAFFPVQSI